MIICMDTGNKGTEMTEKYCFVLKKLCGELEVIGKFKTGERKVFVRVNYDGHFGIRDLLIQRIL